MTVNTDLFCDLNSCAKLIWHFGHSCLNVIFVRAVSTKHAGEDNVLSFCSPDCRKEYVKEHYPSYLRYWV